MDLLGGHVRRGLEIEGGVVVVHAIGQRSGALGLCRGVGLVGGQPAGQTVVARFHLAGHGADRGFVQGVGVRRADLAAGLQRLDLAPGVGQQGAVGPLRKRRAGGQPGDLTQRPVVFPARHANTEGGRRLGLGQGLIQRDGDQSDPGDISLHVRFRIHPMEVDQEIRQAGVNAAPRENVAMAPPDLARFGPIQLEGPHLEGRPALFVELCGIKPGLHAGHAFAPPRQLSGLGRLASVGQSVVLVLAALRGQVLRVHLQFFFVRGVEIDGQRIAGRGKGRDLGEGRRDGGEGRAGRGGHEGAAIKGLAHVSSGLIGGDVVVHDIAMHDRRVDPGLREGGNRDKCAMLH